MQWARSSVPSLCNCWGWLALLCAAIVSGPSNDPTESKKAADEQKQKDVDVVPVGGPKSDESELRELAKDPQTDPNGENYEKLNNNTELSEFGKEMGMRDGPTIPKSMPDDVAPFAVAPCDPHHTPGSGCTAERRPLPCHT